MVPLAIGPNRLQHVDFNNYYVRPQQFGRFADVAVWRDAIFAHLENNHELVMLRLWQCVVANHQGSTPPSLNDLIEPPATPFWRSLAITAVWTAVILTSLLLVLRCFRTCLRSVADANKTDFRNKC